MEILEVHENWVGSVHFCSFISCSFFIFIASIIEAVSPSGLQILYSIQELLTFSTNEYL